MVRTAATAIQRIRTFTAVSWLRREMLPLPDRCFRSPHRSNARFSHGVLIRPGDVLIDARCFFRRRIASLCYHQSQSEFFLTPYAPGNIRNLLSVMFGLAFSFTEAGRKRVPIVTPDRFFKRFPIEGLALQATGSERSPHFFQEYFSDDARVRIIA